MLMFFLNQKTFVKCIPAAVVNYCVMCVYKYMCMNMQLYMIFYVMCVCVSDVLWSLIGVVVWTGIIVAWVTVFQLHRADWGAAADQISFIIPKGIP